ncbi:hypothetical protein [Neokomagataea thailandica]|uniref:Uncharacterized protein n=1 Tax=Neokomagataea tanensis NBRC 106556 TaxID=1223519 RepID=A0ABQ0QIG1_9PROT|nr:MULTISPECIES: hypothetical protein [Neokomagataea]GBR45967.1 hypothetical protein AA106556_0950 [Neokomagataea tanensis NBRC 106556]
MTTFSVGSTVRFRSDAEIEAIGTGLINQTLPKERWTHNAHLAAAVWISAARPDLIPSRDMPGIIRAYNESTGVPNSDTRGYHETITQASLQAVQAFLVKLATDTPLYIACNALLDSRYGGKNWLLEYWTHALLFSPAARRSWIEPDLAPLPF